MRALSLALFVFASSFASAARAETSPYPYDGGSDWGPPDTTFMADTGTPYDTGALGSDLGVTDTSAPRRSMCSDDRTGVVTPEGVVYSCMPYRCLDGACRTSCESTTVCAKGFECVAWKCVEIVASKPDDGAPDATPEQTVKYGCATGGPPSGLAALFVIVGALALAQRRSRDRDG